MTKEEHERINEDTRRDLEVSLNHLLGVIHHSYHKSKPTIGVIYHKSKPTIGVIHPNYHNLDLINVH